MNAAQAGRPNPLAQGSGETAEVPSSSASTEHRKLRVDRLRNGPMRRDGSSDFPWGARIGCSRGKQPLEELGMFARGRWRKIMFELTFPVESFLRRDLRRKVSILFSSSSETLVVSSLK